jgi:hypothetical protein|eukprot:COSAG02_NODE_3496_length_6655_cov_3.090909_2_plen_175_part_00
MFGVVIEGYPPATNFNQVEEARFMLADPLPHGSSLKRLTFFLTALPAPIPDGLVASVYVSMYPHEHWRCLGHVSNSEPSKILNVDWPEADVRDQPPEAPCQIGVTIEAAHDAAQVVAAQVALQEEFGKKIGMDLMTFMESFNHGVGIDLFNKWFEKLQFKLRHQPEWAKFRLAA